MSKAIGIKITKAGDFYDVGASKFFGAPTIPGEWLDDRFTQDEIFFCQIRLSDIAKIDSENRLPHEGYLYFFLRTANGKYALEAVIRDCLEKPRVAVDRFNECVEGYEHLVDDYLIEFFEVDEDYEGTKLFGTPSSWQYAENSPKLLLQFDPLDTDAGFLSEVDGYLYFFLGEDELDLSQVKAHLEHS